MKREDAIAAYGHHYTIDAHSGTINEALGHADPADAHSYADTETARAALLERLASRTTKRIGEIDALFARPANKITIFMAQCGLKGDSRKILKNVARLRTEKMLLQTDRANNFTGRVKTAPLPETIRIPHALSIGDEIHVVRADYLEPGIRTTTAKITSRNLWTGSFSRGDWDYIFAYNAKNEQGRDFSFEYNHTDGTTPEIANNMHGHRYFLTREAAEDHVLELATRMAAHFNAVALEHRLRVLDRGRNPDGKAGAKPGGAPPAPQP